MHHFLEACVCFARCATPQSHMVTLCHCAEGNCRDIDDHLDASSLSYSETANTVPYKLLRL